MGSASVPEYVLNAHSPLNGYTQEFSGVAVSEIVDRLILSVSIPAGEKTEFEAALQAGFGLSIPKTGRVTTSGSSTAYLLGLQKNLYFLVYDAPAREPAIERLKAAIYHTDQSDNWVMLLVDGEKCREVLARICPVDLHPAKFPVGKVVRSLMAHVGVIIYRPSDDSFCLLAPSSSAESFLQALEAAAISALG